MTSDAVDAVISASPKGSTFKFKSIEFIENNIKSLFLKFETLNLGKK
jgi:hypothetical protein